MKKKKKKKRLGAHSLQQSRRRRPGCDRSNTIASRDSAAKCIVSSQTYCFLLLFLYFVRGSTSEVPKHCSFHINEP